MAPLGPPVPFSEDGPAFSRSSSSSSLWSVGKGNRGETRSRPVAGKKSHQQSRVPPRQKGRWANTDALVGRAWEALVNTFAECHYVLRQNEKGLHPLSPPVLTSPSKVAATGRQGGSPSKSQVEPFRSNALTYQPVLALPSSDNLLRKLSSPGNSRENGFVISTALVGRQVCDSFACARSAKSAALPDGYLCNLGDGQGGGRGGIPAGAEDDNHEWRSTQLCRKPRTRRGVLSEAMMLDRLTNQQIAEIQYEFAARNGEVNVAEFIHILGRHLRDSEKTDEEYLTRGPRNIPTSFGGGSSLACLPGPTQISIGDGPSADTGMKPLASVPLTQILGSEGNRDCDSVSGVCVRVASPCRKRMSLNRSRGSISHETVQRELEEAGRLTELFDLIDVDDTQKVSWEAFTTFVVDRGRNGDALKRLHMQRMEKADFHDTRVHVCAIERLTPGYDPAIGLDVVFYYEEGSKTVELVDPFLQPIQNQPPLQRAFNITAVAYCPLVHHLVIAAADLSLTFYDLTGTLVGQNASDCGEATSNNRADIPRSGSTRPTASVGTAADSTTADSSLFWRVTRTFKTRTSQIVLFPSASRPWIFSADHEGSIYAWDLAKICGGSAGASSSSRVALSPDPLAYVGENPRSRAGVSEARPIDLSTLIPPAKVDGIRPLYLRRLARSSSLSPATQSSIRAGENASGGVSPYVDSAGRSDHASGRSTCRALSSSGGNSAFARRVRSGDFVLPWSSAASTQSPAASQSRLGRHSASCTRQWESNQGASLVGESSASDGVSLFDSFTNENRPSIVLGSRRQRKVSSREHTNSLATGETPEDPPESRPRSPLRETFSKSRPSSEASGSDGTGEVASRTAAASPAHDPLVFNETQRGSHPSSVCATNRSRTAGLFESSNGGVKVFRQSPGYTISPQAPGGLRCQTGEISPSAKSASSPRRNVCRLFQGSRAAGSSSAASRVSSHGLQSSASGAAPFCGNRGTSPDTNFLSRRLGHSGGGVEGNTSIPQEPQFQFLRWRQYRAHDDIVTSFEELEVMDLLASCGMDAKIYLWDTDSGELKRTLDGHVRGVRALCFDVENRVLLSGGFDYKLLAWNPYVGKKLHTIRGHSAPVVSICMLGAQSRQFVSFDSEGIAKAWDLSTSACLQTLVAEDQSCVRAVIALPHHRTLLSAGRKLVALTYGLIQEATPSAGSGRGAKLDFHPTAPSRVRGQHSTWGRHPLGMTKRGKAHLTGGGPDTSGAPVLAKAVTHLVVRVLVTAAGRHLRVWDLCTGALVSSIEHVCEEADHCISDICMDEKGRKVFVADQQGCICAYSVCTGQLLQRFTSHRSEVSQLLYVGGEDRNLISVSWDRSIVIHNDAPVFLPNRVRREGHSAAEPTTSSTLPSSLLPPVVASPKICAGGSAGKDAGDDITRTNIFSSDMHNAGPCLALDGGHGQSFGPGASVRSSGRARPEASCRGAPGEQKDLDRGRTSPQKARFSFSEGGSMPTLPRVGHNPVSAHQAQGEGGVWRIVMNAHLGDVTCCAFSRRLGLLATGSSDRAIFVWDYERLRRVTSLFGHKYDVTNLSFIDPLPLLCSADVGGTLCIWVLPPHPHAIRVLETIPSPVLGPQPALVRQAHFFDPYFPAGTSADPMRDVDVLGGSVAGAGGRSREAWKESQGVTWQVTEQRFAGHRRFSMEEHSGKAVARGVGSGKAVGSVQEASTSPRGTPRQARDSSEAARISARESRVSSPLNHASSEGQRCSPQLSASTGLSEVPVQSTTLPSAASSATAGPPPSSTARGIPATLLLLRIVDMERVGSATPLTALAVSCRLISASSGVPCRRCLRFTDSNAVTAVPENGQSTNSGSAAPMSQNAVGIDHEGIIPKNSTLASIQDCQMRRTSSRTGHDDTADIPGVPHSTTFLTSSDGSEPPGSRPEENPTPADTKPFPFPAKGRQPCGNARDSVSLPQAEKSSPSHDLLRSNSEELEGVGEILIFVGDERGRVRVWDVSVILALLPGTEQVVPKTDWQPHRVYRGDLRESTMGLFKQVVQLRRAAQFPYHGSSNQATGTHATTSQARCRWNESPQSASSRLKVSTVGAERGRSESGSGTLEVDVDDLPPAPAREENSGAGGFQEEVRSSKAGDTREVDQRERNGSELAHYRSLETVTNMRRNSVRAPGGVTGSPEEFSRVTGRLSVDPGGGSISVSSSVPRVPGGVDVSSYFQYNVGEASVDPFLLHDEMPALFPRAPLKLIGMWKAHSKCVKSLQVLQLGSNTPHRNERSGNGPKTQFGTSDEEAADENLQISPRKRGCGSSTFRVLLASAGEDGAARIWDVSGLSRSQGVQRKPLPTMFLDLAEERQNASAVVASPSKGCSGQAVLENGFHMKVSIADESHPKALDTASCLSLENARNVLALPPSGRAPCEPATARHAGAQQFHSSLWDFRQSEGAPSFWAPSSASSSCASGSSSFRFASNLPLSSASADEPGASVTSQDQPVVLVGDLQAQTSMSPGEQTACGGNLMVGHATAWNVDLGELDGPSFGTVAGNGTVAPAVGGARRLLETHLRVKELARQQRLEEQQASVQLESSLQLEVPHLLLPAGEESNDEGDTRRRRDGPGESRKTFDDTLLPEEYTIGPNGQVILGGGNWVQGADKGGGIWAAVYAKRRSLVERTASF
ncbi:WD domain, G-beta repeat-containing protein [Toxoplasma gondii GAB2-2007-GAL-DOM2]|uniref:WD domain, G-beta repeat-containing protein n=5 Tax=Toxoplasma gondii TaxID=5811 RepID=B9QLS7_TOXGV|nr:WD domain, G-beta repeat-containing protein [Toxoplasma gondii VEG]KFG38383.1 WD domain, G-beta repeat-containing protein [Toxoplasma gondii p89]KFG47727.1 WD domain, G-beta repeat-containing protein [Toxoplasma gondii GAB2-2007-GAL-DOM2]KFG50965.1 WD domain, G-beta repeat-containing protein [Toxoplasma gondii FOU]PUA88823.1 WD domain, G-beta repeat-containing protein [Toxoplasma gondii TgCATBr9]